MHNMLADAIVDAIQGWKGEYGDATLITFDIQSKPDVKRYRPGMGLDVLHIEFACMSPDVVVTVTKTMHLTHDSIVTVNRLQMSWGDTRQFLRGLLSGVKPFNFLKQDPFFQVTKDERSQTKV